MSGGGSKKISVKNTTPEWISSTGKWAAGQLPGAISSLQNYERLSNPYGEFSDTRFNGLFGNDGGAKYLENYMAAPKQAFNEGLAQVKNIYGSNGLYGSVGGGLMSSALGDVTGNYATSMANAQNMAAQQYANDWQNQIQAMALRARPKEFENESSMYNNQQQQNYVNSILGAYSPSAAMTMQGQVVQPGGGGSSWGSGLGSLLGGGLSLLGATYGGDGWSFSSEEFKTGIEDAPDALPIIEKLHIKEWEYKPENKASMDPQGESGGRHIGPMAEDWSANMNGSGGGMGIPHQDAIGLALKALQELNQRIKEIEGSGK